MLSDAQWAMLEPLVEACRPKGGILARSCSGAAREQIRVVDHPALAIQVDDVMAGWTSAADLVAFIRAPPVRQVPPS